MPLLEHWHKDVAELLGSIPPGAVLCTSMQYSFIISRLMEVANDIISGTTIEDVGLDVHAKFDCSSLFDV